MTKAKKTRFWNRRDKAAQDDKTEEVVELTTPPPVTIEQMQEEVDTVTNVMHENLVKIRDRHGKLEEIENRADKIQEQALVFNKLSRRYRIKMMLRNNKMTIAIVVVVVLVLICVTFVILYCFGVFHPDEKSS